MPWRCGTRCGPLPLAPLAYWAYARLTGYRPTAAPVRPWQHGAMSAEKDGKPRFFESAAAFRKWLELNHAKKRVLSVGFHNARSDKTGLTYKQAVDEALCYGWIDGVRRSFDETRYTCRFTPRKASSYWSAVNTRRFYELEKLGRVAKPGAEVFARRDATKTNKYSFEREQAKLSKEQLAEFRANKPAWTFFESQAPWYQRVATHLVRQGKKPETQARRLAHLIDCSARGERIAQLVSKKK